MTVMVTGASGVVGRATVKTLLARDEVRATVRRAADASYLRQLGAKVAVRDIDTPDALSEILPGCHTLVHLIGGVAQPDPDELFHVAVLMGVFWHWLLIWQFAAGDPAVRAEVANRH